ncbi:MAG: DNA-binding protein [Candidatus Omnitrophica bacterium]|nr:DNA-binding protein [Candidatus Omnitrophota bacterium]
MKINYKLALPILFLILAVYPKQIVFCQSISSSELIRNANEYDGKPVTYTGEAIGDIMLRGDFAWVNINDGANALGVWMSASLAKEIEFVGNYKSRGDILEVGGIFHRACLEHGGDMDIHAQALRKLRSGRMFNQQLNPGKKNLSIFLFGALFLIWILTLFRRR